VSVHVDTFAYFSSLKEDCGHLTYAIIVCSIVQVCYLGNIGGGQYETNNAQLRMLMTNAVAGRMNFAGCGKKTGIVEMKLLNAVIGEL